MKDPRRCGGMVVLTGIGPCSEKEQTHASSRIVFVHVGQDPVVTLCHELGLG